MYARPTVRNRQEQHPLRLHDPDALRYIKLIKLEYIEKEIQCPVPRCQLVPDKAFGELHGRAVLVCTSHAWFFQHHPDPDGRKLEVIREYFAPKLRNMYPKTDILIFDDWLCCPQKPRTEEENEIFSNSMNHMNSMYVYCDSVLFIETDLPQYTDTNLYKQTLIPAKHRWKRFVDCVQYAGGEEEEGTDASSKDDDKDETTSLRISPRDIVRKIDGVPINENVEELESRTIPTTIEFSRCPFGRRNPVPTDKRGWLFLERITVAIKAAAAGKAQFNNIVVTNATNLQCLLAEWTELLRRMAANKDRSVLKKSLSYFEKKLTEMIFTFESDLEPCMKMLNSLVTKFADNWEAEVAKQKSMKKRAREILLSWGSFSPQYVETLRLHDKERPAKMYSELLVMFLGMAIVPTALACVLFVLPIDGPPSVGAVDNEGSLPSAWSRVGANFVVATSLVVSQNLITDYLIATFARIPIGWHSVLRCVLMLPAYFGLRTILSYVSYPAVPFELLIYFAIFIPFFSVVWGVKWIPRVDKFTGLVEYWNLGSWVYFPASMRFDDACRERLGLCLRDLYLIFGLVSVYPILGSIIIQFDTLLQAALLPLFYGLRFLFEKISELVRPTHARTHAHEHAHIRSLADCQDDAFDTIHRRSLAR